MAQVGDDICIRIVRATDLTSEKYQSPTDGVTFVQLQVGRTLKRSRAIPNETSPIWDEDFFIHVEDAYLVLVVKDENWDPNQYVGACKFSLSSLTLGEPAAVQLRDATGQHAGKIVLQVDHAPSEEVTPPAAPIYVSEQAPATAPTEAYGSKQHPTSPQHLAEPPAPKYVAPPTAKDTPSPAPIIISQEGARPEEREAAVLCLLDCEELVLAPPGNVFVTVVVGNLTKKTKSVPYRDIASWDDKFGFALIPQDTIEINVRSDDDDLLGIGVLTGKTVLARRGGADFWIVLEDDDLNPVGKLRLTIQHGRMPTSTKEHASPAPSAHLPVVPKEEVDNHVAPQTTRLIIKVVNAEELQCMHTQQGVILSCPFCHTYYC